MSEPKLNYLPCTSHSAHRMAYWQWGDHRARQTVVCVHGLARQGRDFDTLARSLCAHAADLCVVCPDVVGRGASDWLSDPLGYQLPTYVADMLQLLQHLQPASLDWVGTSMGGLIGMGVAGALQAMPQAPSQVRRLVLNDVGPVIQWQAIARIATYLGRSMRFDSVEQASQALWAISSGFGPHTAEQWRALTEPMLKPLNDGSQAVRLHYDPAIAAPIAQVTAESAAQGEALLWQIYDQLRCQTLLLRGAESDLLSPQTAHQMRERGPRARLVTFAGVGHAPTLVATEQVEVVCDFLLD